MERLTGLSAKFLAEEILLGVEFLDDGCRRPHALVQLFEDVVVDQSQADVFVAPRLTRVAVDLAEQVESGAVAGGGRRLGSADGFGQGGCGIGRVRRGGRRRIGRVCRVRGHGRRGSQLCGGLGSVGLGGRGNAATSEHYA